MKLDWLTQHTAFGRNDWIEILLSTLGVFIAITTLMTVLYVINGDAYVGLIVASMGASAVILFSTPHAPMAQPWALVMGQFIAAICGLAAWNWIPNLWISLPVAVASATLLMLLLKCRHAPGGATALFIALGGKEVEMLNWSLLWLNFLPSLLTLLTIAIIVNFPFSWRRYPARFLTPQAAAISPTHEQATAVIDHTDLMYASEHLKGYFELSETEFMAIYTAAKAHHQQNHAASLVDHAHTTPNTVGTSHNP